MPRINRNRQSAFSKFDCKDTTIFLIDNGNGELFFEFFVGEDFMFEVTKDKLLRYKICTLNKNDNSLRSQIVTLIAGF